MRNGLGWFGVLVWACCTARIFAGNVLDPNFVESVVVSGQANLGSISGIAWAPDTTKRLFAIRKTGEVRIIKDGALLPTPFATVSPVFTNSECGVIGICFDPNFSANHYVYLFVTVSATEQQIIRYTDSSDIGTDKTVLISGLPTRGQNHDGGAIGIGPDGKLYFAIGDLGSGTGVNTDVLSMASKICRANLDGSAPTDNPFFDGAGANNDYIWARGFRNPYTFTFQPGTGKLWVNVVGTNYEQIFVVNAGDHAGWNDYENNQPAGFVVPLIKYKTNGVDVVSVAATRQNNVAMFNSSAPHGFRKGEKLEISVATASFNGEFFITSVPSPTSFTIAQTGPNEVGGSGSATTLNIGGCVTGGTFYDGTAFPEAYRGNFFFGDFNTGRIVRVTFDAQNTIATVDLFVTGVVNCIDMATGPDGALYYASYADGAIYKLAAKEPAPPNNQPPVTGSDDTDSDGVVNSVDADDDNDGVSDTDEAVDGTNPNDANSILKREMEIKRIAGKLNFARNGNDTLQVSGLLPAVQGIANVGNTLFVVNVGGVSATFDLDDRGRDKDSNGALSLKMKLKREKGEDRSEFAGGDVPFSVKLAKGSFSSSWADEGINPATTTKAQSVSFVVEIRFNGRVYAATVQTVYSGKAGKSGRFKN